MWRMVINVGIWNQYCKVLSAWILSACMFMVFMTPGMAWAQTGETVQAVHTLAHEAVHLAGVRNEAEAECYGLQTVDLVAVRLGADRDTARALADYALARLYPALPSHYRTDACRDGGSLDLEDGHGPGATFRLVLPLAVEAVRRPALKLAPARADTPSE